MTPATPEGVTCGECGRFDCPWTKPRLTRERRRARIRSKEWHIQFTLPWEVWVADTRKARFRDERDARGFAKARYGAAAEILNLYEENDVEEAVVTGRPAHDA